MMLMPDRKKAVTVIVAGLGGGEDMGMEDDLQYAMKSCCLRLMKCMEEKDVDGFCEYMKEFIEMCKNDNPKPEMEDY